MRSSAKTRPSIATMKDTKVERETAVLRVACEIGVREKQHQRADAAYQQAESQAEPVDHEGKADIERGHPVDAPYEALARRNLRQETEKPRKEVRRRRRPAQCR